MSKTNVDINVSGVFTSLLTVLFIALKLTGYITWSWWWVLSPLWIPVALLGIFFAVFGLAYLLVEMLKR